MLRRIRTPRAAKPAAGFIGPDAIEVFPRRIRAGETWCETLAVIGYPREVSPLARAKRGNPALVERFEVFVGGMEMANAFSEQNDPEAQAKAFEEQMARRAAGDEEAQMMDHDYVRALEYGMPPTGGVGIGMDRLTMLATGSRSIRDVILFPQLRPEEGRAEIEHEVEEPVAEPAGAPAKATATARAKGSRTP